MKNVRSIFMNQHTRLGIALGMAITGHMRSLIDHKAGYALICEQPSYDRT